MKIANQTHGPLKITKIEYYPRLSQETLAFNANLEINGVKGTVQNEGHGGPNFYGSREIQNAVTEYARTLPSYTGDGFTLTYDADLLISEVIGRAADEAELGKAFKKMALKGYKVACRFGNQIVYCTATPKVEDLVKRYGEGARSATFTQISA